MKTPQQYQQEIEHLTEINHRLHAQLTKALDEVARLYTAAKQNNPCAPESNR